MGDLVKRLLAGTGGGKPWMDLHGEAAARIEALEARVAAADKLAEALTPFAFFDPDEPDITSDTTQKAWELRYKDRFKDWIDYGQIEDARTALAAYQATKEQSE